MFPLRDTIPSEKVPIVNYLVMGICILVFLFESTMPTPELESFLSTYGLVPANFLSQLDAAQVETVFSSMFLHGGWAHVLGNMWFLFIFGDNVEDRLGHVGYLLFYLFTGICAAGTQVFIQAGSHVAMVGASGAISGVLGAYFVLFPQSRVVALIPAGYFSRTMEVPAIFFLGIWFVMQLLPGVSSLAATTGDVGGVAFWAHVGGFVSGWILAQFIPKEGRRPPREPFDYQ
jgi:membrane associated rhomboid family serine protease